MLGNLGGLICFPSFPLVGELFRDELLVHGCSCPRHRRGTNRNRGNLGPLPVLSCVPGEGLIVKPCFIPLHLSLETWFCHVVWEPACGTRTLFAPRGLQLLLCVHPLSFALVCPTTSAGTACSCSSSLGCIQHKPNPGCLWGSPCSSVRACSNSVRKAPVGSVRVARGWLSALPSNFFQHS